MLFSCLQTLTIPKRILIQAFGLANVGRLKKIVVFSPFASNCVPPSSIVLFVYNCCLLLCKFTTFALQI